MSLLADLLSKVNYRKQEGNIPPVFERVITDAKRKRIVKKQIVIIGGSAIIMIFIGLGVVYYINDLTAPPLSTSMVRADIQPVVQPQKVESKHPESSPISVHKMDETKFGKHEKTVSQETTKVEHGLSRRKESKVQFPIDNKYFPSQIIEESVEKVTKLPKELTVSRKTERDGFLYTAKNYEADRDYYQALNYYRKALEIDKRNYVIMNNISSLLIGMGLYEEAKNYSKDALSIHKDYIPSLVNIGISCVQLGSPDEGKAYLLKAVSLDPSNKNVLLNIALLYEKTKEYDEAGKIYSRLYQMKDIQGYLGIARIAENTNRPDDAKEIYREILTLNNVDFKTKKIVSEKLGALESK